jgi:hypothetical protein
MSFLPRKICCLILPGLLLGCGPFPDLRGIVAGDISPPVLLGAESMTTRSARLFFNEPVTPLDGSMTLEPTIQPSTVSCTDNTVLLDFSNNLTPGAPYFIESTVEDKAGNRTRFITQFYGFNPRVPLVIINEFITQGSGSHPDILELLVLEDGNLSGICVLEGTKSNWSDRCILPSTEVSAGDFVLVHFKPEGIASEIDEMIDRGASGGKDTSPTAWDYWVPEGNGLSGNNGVLTVYDKPEGRLLDGVLYSNRTSSSDQKYRGFGTKDVMLKADELHSEGGWKAAGELISPEDGINPDQSTSTRSICRSSSSLDTDLSADWHVTPTRGSTFGVANSDEVYIEEN